MRSSPTPVSIEGRGSGCALLLRHLLELHEDEIPEFEEAIAVLLRAARRSAPDLLAVVDRRSPSTDRTGRYRPSPRNCPRSAMRMMRSSEKPGDLLPETERLVVVVVDGDEQLVLLAARIPW